MGAIFDREHEPPAPDATDAAHGLVRGALNIGGAVVGGTASAALIAVAEVFQLVVAPPLTRRTQDWMEEIAAAIRRLESQRGVRLEDLRDNPAFIDALISGTQAAVRTSQAGKRTALKNAVLNAGLPGAPDATQQQIFLVLTDRFTESHLILLNMFHNPREFRDRTGQPPSFPAAANATTMVEVTFPDAKARPDLYHKLWSDLYAEKLVKTAAIDNGAEGDWSGIKRTTTLGMAYLAFITDPLAKENLNEQKRGQ